MLEIARKSQVITRGVIQGLHWGYIAMMEKDMETTTYLLAPCKRNYALD